MHDLRDAVDENELKLRLAKKYVEYTTKRYRNPKLAYGTNYLQWCFKAELVGEYAPMGSYRNGSAMRVSPAAWYFDTLEETLHFARLSASVTHDHPEGEKGAMCIAAAIFLARSGAEKKDIKRTLIKMFRYDALKNGVQELRNKHVWNCICQDTVPQAIAAFLESTDFESAVRLALSYGGDADTLAAMAGGIAEAYYGGVPQHIWDFCRARLDKHALSVIEEWNKTVRKAAHTVL